VKEHYFGDGKQDHAEELKFSSTSLVRAINRQWKESLDDFTASNTTGEPRNSSGTHQKVTYFYVTTPGQRPKKPQVAQIFEEEDLQDEFVLRARKRKKASGEVEQKNAALSQSATKKSEAEADLNFLSYWESPEANSLFLPVQNESIPECLMRRIQILGHCSSKASGWVDCVETHDKDGLCSEFNAHKIRQQCNLLSQAYIFALDHMNQHPDYDKVNKTWADCCDKAIRHLNPLGIIAATNGRTIQTWHCEFCRQENFQRMESNTSHIFSNISWKPNNLSWILPTIISQTLPLNLSGTTLLQNFFPVLSKKQYLIIANC
jgi:hypothetical protein